MLGTLRWLWYVLPVVTSASINASSPLSLQLPSLTQDSNFSRNANTSAFSLVGHSYKDPDSPVILYYGFGLWKTRLDFYNLRALLAVANDSAYQKVQENGFWQRYPRQRGRQTYAYGLGDGIEVSIINESTYLFTYGDVQTVIEYLWQVMIVQNQPYRVDFTFRKWNEDFGKGAVKKVKRALEES